MRSHERGTSPRPPRKPKDAYMSYRTASPEARPDTPDPTHSYRTVLPRQRADSPGETESFVPVQPAIYHPTPVNQQPQADHCYMTCRECLYFWFIQCVLIALVVAITYLAIHLYRI